MPRDHDDDYARLRDMPVHAREIVDTVGSVTLDDYRRDKTLRLATERRPEIIGEAARNISRELQLRHPEIPWQKIVAMRHVLAHEYGVIKHDIIYRVATMHTPQVIDSLEPLVPPLPES